jgi:hypothetical protein
MSVIPMSRLPYVPPWSIFSETHRAGAGWSSWVLVSTGWGRRLVEPGSSAFAAPVSPPTMRRSNELKNTSAGIIGNEVNASTFAVSNEYCDAKACTPQGQGEGVLIVQDEQRQQVGSSPA